MPTSERDSTRIMHIAFVTTEFVSEAYFSGGLANYLYRVARALVARGHEVDVLLLCDNQPDKRFVFDSIRVTRVKFGTAVRLFGRFRRSRFAWPSMYVEMALRSWRHLRRIHHERPVDIVQFPQLSGMGVFSLFLLRVPQVIRFSSYTPTWNIAAGYPRESFDARFIEWWETLQLHFARHIFGPTQAVKEMILDAVGEKDIRLIPTPIYNEAEARDDAVYHEHLDGRRYALFIGRLDLHKGPAVLGQALPRVFAEQPDFTIAFVGKDSRTPLAPSMREWLRQQLAPWLDRVVFVDQTDHARLYPIIEHARFVVLPALIDNMPNAALETMALGRPVLGARGASFEEFMTEGITGFLSPAGDVPALADKLLEVWRLPDERLAEVGRAARESCARFAPDLVVDQLVTYYEEIIRQAKGR